jgi:uncharacterized protein (TIGR03435 family)
MKRHSGKISKAYRPGSLKRGYDVLSKVLGGVFVIASSTNAVARPQQQPAPPAAFVVASIKPAQPADPGSLNFKFLPSPDGLRARSVTVRDCILWAYTLEDYQVSGPSTLDSNKYDIVARAGGRVKVDDLRLMLQTLLTDRFKLTFHRADREASVYRLDVEKGGPRLRPASGDESYTSSSDSGVRTLAGKLSIDGLVRVLRRQLEHTVSNNTKLEGLFEIKLQYRLDDRDPSTTMAASAPSLSTALRDQLGLRLVPVKGSVESLIVDHVERAPTEN